MSASVTIGRPGQFADFERYCSERMEAAALRATARAARQATKDVRAAMRGAGLGKLSNAIGTGSDLAKSGRARLRGSGFSASGWIHVRGRSERTIGALQSAFEGGPIVPRRGRFLWIATKQLQRTAGSGRERRRLTPALYVKHGLDKRIGPLEFMPGRRSGEGLLVVRQVTLDRRGRGGARHGPRRLPKRGGIGGTRRRVELFIAFVGIRATSRAARVKPTPIIAANAARLPALIAEEVSKEL